MPLYLRDNLEVVLVKAGEPVVCEEEEFEAALRAEETSGEGGQQVLAHGQALKAGEVFEGVCVHEGELVVVKLEVCEAGEAPEDAFGDARDGVVLEADKVQVGR